MINPRPDAPHILFLFSDTGGGHRSAAEAIVEALNLEYKDLVRTTMVDVFDEYAPRPLNHLPALYPLMVRAPRAWGLGFRLSNGRRRTVALTYSMWPYVRNSLRRFMAANACDMIVSVHPMLIGSVLRALGEPRPYFVTVVTDLVTPHAFWYSREADLCLVPTAQARQRALGQGLTSEQVREVGLPVAGRFCKPSGDRKSLRDRYGWPQERPLVLLVGGGEGIGPLEEITRAIAANLPSVTLVVVAGRNKKLRSRLESQQWQIPVYVYGFIRAMPDFMRAADILVTKAGPGTISEALIAELPMVLYSHLPGQEDGNLTFVVSQGVGVWAPKPEQIVAVIGEWINHPEQYKQAVATCKRLARPDAARQIAHILMEKLRLAVQ